MAYSCSERTRSSSLVRANRLSSRASIRLRCGSDTLRARLRDGQLLAQVGSGESKVLVPVNDPRASPGDAYGDGKLTLYKVPETQSWALASGNAAAAECKPAP